MCATVLELLWEHTLTYFCNLFMGPVVEVEGGLHVTGCPRGMDGVHARTHAHRKRERDRERFLV